ncbi:S-layer homology domain-containing protein [Agathobaculum desmolans]|uniref:S-layer homology domain-containing protein n=1 Tax=Agathobaculum desmolans TaxID=39484 RepID=UPI00248D5955|nr:S-layer homology domain-containing protein [Agathobaculum desmolans]
MNTKNKIVSSMLVCCILIASMPVNALALSAGETILGQESIAAASSSNRCGENLTWQYENHTLTVSGTGDMTDWSSWEETPWAALGDEIRQIIIEKGVTSIGDYAFSGCPNLQRVYLPVSVTNIGIKGLNNSGRFPICYEGYRFDWEKIEKYEYGENISLAPDSYAFLATNTVNTYYSDPIVFDDTTDTNVKPTEGFELSNEQLARVKQALGVPENLDVQVSIGDRITYWDAAEMWLIDISFYHDGEMVAGALFNADTLELGRNITMYSGDIDTPSSWATEEVDAARDAGIIPENLDSKYQDNITREEFCEIATALVESKTGEAIADVLDQKGLTSHNPFSDTTNSDVVAMNALGVVNGTGEGRFSPNDEITREEAATMLTRLAKSMNLSGPGSIDLSFTDTNYVADWACYGVGFISSCQDKTNGNFVMGGTGDNEFSPDDAYTREQAIASFLRLYNAIGSCTASQIRVDASHDTADLDIVSFQGYTNNALPMANGLPVIGLKIPDRAESANDGIFVLEDGNRLDTDEYEVWLKPYENEPLPAEITEGFRIKAYQTGSAILTVQSKVTGTVWETFNLIITDNDDRTLYDLAIPVQTMDTVLYGKQAFNFANCGIYVEDYTVEIQPNGDHYITLTAYNTNAVDGAFDIYDKDGNYLYSKRIDKNDILPSSPWEAITDVFMIGYDIGSGDALTYRQNGQSTKAEIEFEVPAGGAVIMSNNTATSPGAMSYNLSSYILSGVDAAKSLVDLNKDQKKLLNDSLAKAIQDSLKELGNTITIQKTIAGGMKDVAQNVTVQNAFTSADNIISGWLNTLSSAGIDWEQLLYDVEDSLKGYLVNLPTNSITGLIEKAGGPAGATLKYMFTISNMVEMIPQIVQMCSATECEDVYILVRQDLPWN